MIRLDLRSFICGVAVAVMPSMFVGQATAIDFSNVPGLGQLLPQSVKSLVSIKSNLDKDVKALTGDAKNLFSSKDNLITIKNQLVTLSTQTKTQIDTITTLIGGVESQLKSTQTNIQSTASHVGEIDQVRKALQGNK